MIKKYLLLPVLLVAFLLLVSWYTTKDEPKENGLGSFAVEASLGCATATATTSPAYMSVGTATSTVTCPLTRVGTDAPSTATLLVQLNASSSATTVRIFIEESIDNIDFYPIAANQVASSTDLLFDLAGRAFVEFRAASSTIGGNAPGQGTDNRLGVEGLDNRNHYQFEIPVRLNYVRAIASIASSTLVDTCLTCGEGAVWMHIIPKVEL